MSTPLSGDNSGSISFDKGADPVKITLPVNRQQFAEFIVGLLGNPQRLSQRYYGYFEMNVEYFQHLHHTIRQRITEQNDGVISEFMVTLYYSDRSTVVLASFQDFLNYQELRSVRTIAISLSWVILIVFPGKQFPERQVIDIDLYTNEYLKRKGTKTERNFIIDTVFGEGTHWNDLSGELHIRHTARTWGNDIFMLLSPDISGRIGNQGLTGLKDPL